MNEPSKIMLTLVVMLIVGALLNLYLESLARLLIRWSVRLRYTDLRRREVRGEELQALIGEIPGDLQKFLTAVAFKGYALRSPLGRSPLGKFFRGKAIDRATRHLTRLAVLIAGPRRAWRGEEFRAGLAVGADPGAPPPTARQRLRHAAGLVKAAIVFRAMDLARFLGRILDWFLAEPRTEILVAVVGICSGAYFVHIGGWASLMAQLQNVTAACVMVAGVGLGLRKLRKVPPRKSRSDKSKEREHDTD